MLTDSEKVIPTIYVVCWTEALTKDGGGLFCCDCDHSTVADALNCMCFRPNGRCFVRAVDGGAPKVKCRSLNDHERDIFLREIKLFQGVYA